MKGNITKITVRSSHFALFMYIFRLAAQRTRCHTLLDTNMKVPHYNRQYYHTCEGENHC